MTRLLATACAAAIAAALATPAAAQQKGGLLWEGRPNIVVKDDERHEPSLVPVILSGVAGGVLGIEIAVVTAGIAAGSTASWWLLGSAGAAVGTVGGAVAGEYFFNRSEEKKPAQPTVAAQAQR